MHHLPLCLKDYSCTKRSNAQTRYKRQILCIAVNMGDCCRLERHCKRQCLGPLKDRLIVETLSPVFWLKIECDSGPTFSCATKESWWKGFQSDDTVGTAFIIEDDRLDKFLLEQERAELCNVNKSNFGSPSSSTKTGLRTSNSLAQKALTHSLVCVLVFLHSYGMDY